MPDNICLRRRKLYEAQLADAQTFFEKLAKKYPKMAAAVADPKLIAALEKILNMYVVFGVARDLARLLPSDVLFMSDENARPTIDEALRAAKGSYTFDRRVGIGDAYDRYFAWYITAANVSPAGKPVQSGIDAFFARNAMVAHAVRTVTDHHQKNIELACKRVDSNWDDIDRAFFEGKGMTSLKTIKTTGNDFHKDGKQVLILTFQLADKTEGRIVYKPSGVEIDCRILGDSSVFRDSDDPKGPKAVNPEGYTQETSLTELINDALGKRHGPFAGKPLPTYRILPYARDSIKDTYGFMEFLTHEPQVDITLAKAEGMRAAVGAKVGELDPADVAGSDWIVDKPEDQQAFFYRFGGLMAMALAVSLCDLHLQNLIVHAKAPYLIDLEEALKRPMTSVTHTYLVSAPSSPIGKDKGNYHDPTVVVTVDADKTSALKVRVTTEYHPATCVLYRYLGKNVAGAPAQVGLPDDLPADHDSLGNRAALLQGLEDVFEALATDECNAAAKDWVVGLKGTIARFVPRATKAYAEQSRALFMGYADASIPGAANDAYDQFKREHSDGKNEYFFQKAVRATRETWRGKEKPKTIPQWAPAPEWTWHPYFAAEHPDHAWRDYLNCDIPSFYHFLGKPDLLNTNEQPVNVLAARNWQNDNMTNPGDLRPGWSPNSTGTYLPESPVDMVVRQLEWLRQQFAPPTDKSERRSWARKGTKDAYLKKALEGTPFEADFSRLILNRPSTPKPASGGARK